MFNLSVKAFRTVVYINERNIAFKTLYIYAYLNKFKSALALPEICTDCVYPYIVDKCILKADILVFIRRWPNG